MTNDAQELRLLDDLPVGAEGDSFQHALYADMLAAVFRSPKPGRCVGFFGKWGLGKSSVVKQLEEKLPEQTTVITFNAWKSSGDSIRRQLLLHVLKKIAKNEAERIMNACGTLAPVRLLPPGSGRKKSLCERIKQMLCDPRWWGGAVLLVLALAPLLSVVALNVYLLVVDPDESAHLLQLSQAILIPTFILPVMWLARYLRKRSQLHLSVTQSVPEDVAIGYPEQFEELFIEHVSAYCGHDKDLVVVIDDLDRCDARTVAEALAAIRQFTPDAVHRAGERAEKNFRCQFLVPCDEQQVVLALAAAGHDAGTHGARTHDYESKELLRKFFDVTIRMHEMYQDDFLEYAASLAKDIDLDPQGAREIVALVGPEDPRLVKQLLNALRLSQDRLKRQQQSGAVPPPEELPDLERTERLLVALRETVPRTYSRIAADPSMLEDRASIKWEGEREAVSDAEAARSRRMMSDAGRVSAITAEVLIHGKLPRFLHGVSGGGNLVRSLRHFDQDLFAGALSNLDPTENSNVQQWLTQEARRISKSTAVGLRQLLSLFLQYPESTLDEEFILPCIEGALKVGIYLQEALADHPHLDRLAFLLPRIRPEVASAVHVSLVEGFLSAEGKSDSELRFLLATCKAIPGAPQARFRKWLVDGIKEEKGAEEFVGRISRLFPEDRSLCSGFAPEGAVAAARHPQWEQELIENTHPRQDVVTTLLGDSSQHAEGCLDEILSGDGQLARPRSPNAGTDAAWVSVGCLLDLASDGAVQKSFKSILTWLTVDPAQGSRRALEAFGRNILRLADNEFEQLAQYIVGSLAKAPQETWLVEFVGESPDSACLLERWKQLTGVVFIRYADYLQDLTNLNAPVKAILVKVQELHWPISDRAEMLLSRKLEAPSRLPQFRQWLDALGPLVRVGSKHDTLRTKVLELVGRKREGVDKALAAGLAIPWAREIDVESATAVGQLFIGQQSALSQYEDSWHSLRERKGAGRVLDTMADALPEDTAALNSYGNTLAMIIGGFSLLDGKHKRSFLDETVLSLLLASDMSARQLGIALTAQVPRTTATLRKQLALLTKEGSLSPEQETVASEAAKRPLLRTRRQTTS